MQRLERMVPRQLRALLDHKHVRGGELRGFVRVRGLRSGLAVLINVRTGESGEEEQRDVKADADSVARGRVWSGEAARTRGLVDSLGGIRTACRMALAEAGSSLDEPLDVEEYPRAGHGFMDRLFESWMRDADSDNSETAMLARSFTPVMRAWLTAATFPAGRMLAVLPWSITIR